MARGGRLTTLSCAGSLLNKTHPRATSSTVFLYYQIVVTMEARIFRSRLTSGRFNATAVAAMIRSGRSATSLRGIDSKASSTRRSSVAKGKDRSGRQGLESELAVQPPVVEPS